MNEKKLKKDISLAEHTTFEIGGRTRFFYSARSGKEVVEVLGWAERRDLPVFVLGGGSNILVSDSGFSGLVLKMANEGLEKERETVVAEAGTELSDLVAFYTENSLAGMSWAAGIPGTVGGAIRGNAAAFGGTMGESVLWVTAFDRERGAVRKFGREESEFENKGSLFKKRPFVLLGAGFESEAGEKQELKEEVEKHLRFRRDHHPLGVPSAGCVFKNLSAGPKTKKAGLEEKYPLLKKFNEEGVVPAGYLLDKAGLKGERVGGARVSEEHANFVVNEGGAGAREVRRLIQKMKKVVKKEFGVELEEEIQYLGFE